MAIQKDLTVLMQELEPYRRTDPLRYLKGVAAARDIADPELRFLRAEVLHALAMKLHGAMRLSGLANEIVVRPEGVFVDIGGVLMESSRTGVYLKSSGAPYVNQGAQLSRTLARLQIKVETFVDVGANFGEISLWFARTYPAARIVAIEPSSENLHLFGLNKNAQGFPTGQIEIVQQAVTDQAGSAAMRKVASGMNRVIAAGEADGTESVNCDRLDTLFDRHGIRAADFVKIDIEGGEPKLKDALLALGNRVRSYYIEFSQFARLDEYLALASALLSQRFVCYEETATSTLATVDDISRHLRTAFAPGPLSVTNLWFMGENASRVGR